MLIPNHIVVEVREASPILDIVQDHVRLRKQGRNWVGLCPFHGERTASFNVHPGKGIFKCFGCGKGGDVIQFVMEIERWDFPQAVRFLAQRAGITIPESGQESSDKREPLYNALRFATRFFHSQLRNTSEGHEAGRYLTNRGISPETIKRFGIGYAPDRWDALFQAARAEHIKPEILQAAGLVVARDRGGYYDRFRGRVIFPISSHVGKVIGFGGRRLFDRSDTPKYINSPETQVYHKSRVLYGLLQGKQSVRKAGEVILVEGYTDVLALHQAGVENTVACCGTAITPEQVKLLSRFANRIVLVYDGDTAGIDATKRALETVFAQGVVASVVSLPAGRDPDEFVRESGPEAFLKYLQDRKEDIVKFIHGAALCHGGLNSLESVAYHAEQVLRLIVNLPDPLLRQLYVRRVSAQFAVPEDQLTKKLKQLHVPAQVPVDVSAQSPAVVLMTVPEMALLRIMIEHGGPMIEFIMGRMNPGEFSEGSARHIVERLLALYKEQGGETKAAIDRGMLMLDPSANHVLAHVMMDEYQPSKNWETKNIRVPRINEDTRRVALDAIQQVKIKRVNERLEALKRTIVQAASGSEEQMRYQAQLLDLLKLRRELKSGGYFK